MVRVDSQFPPDRIQAHIFHVNAGYCLVQWSSLRDKQGPRIVKTRWKDDAMRFLKDRKKYVVLKSDSGSTPALIYITYRTKAKDHACCSQLVRWINSCFVHIFFCLIGCQWYRRYSRCRIKIPFLDMFWDIKSISSVSHVFLFYFCGVLVIGLC